MQAQVATAMLEWWDGWLKITQRHRLPLRRPRGDSSSNSNNNKRVLKCILINRQRINWVRRAVPVDRRIRNWAVEGLGIQRRIMRRDHSRVSWRGIECVCIELVNIVLSVISGIWGWQQQADGGPNGPAATSGAVPVVPGPPPPPGAQQGPHGQELSEMLQMLDQTGTNSFEDLNIHMFSTPFEWWREQ